MRQCTPAEAFLEHTDLTGEFHVEVLWKRIAPQKIIHKTLKQ